MSYKGGTELKAWTGGANKGSLHTIQDAARLVWRAGQHQRIWKRLERPGNSSARGKQTVNFDVHTCFVCQVTLTDPATLGFQ